MPSQATQTPESGFSSVTPYPYSLAPSHISPPQSRVGEAAAEEPTSLRGNKILGGLYRVTGGGCGGMDGGEGGHGDRL